MTRRKSVLMLTCTLLGMLISDMTSAMDGQRKKNQNSSHQYDEESALLTKKSVDKKAEPTFTCPQISCYMNDRCDLTVKMAKKDDNQEDDICTSNVIVTSVACLVGCILGCCCCK